MVWSPLVSTATAKQSLSQRDFLFVWLTLFFVCSESLCSFFIPLHSRREYRGKENGDIGEKRNEDQEERVVMKASCWPRASLPCWSLRPCGLHMETLSLVLSEPDWVGDELVESLLCRVGSGGFIQPQCFQALFWPTPQEGPCLAGACVEAEKSPCLQRNKKAPD